MNNCLIITSKEDPHTDYIIDIINSNGFGDRVIRLNTEDFVDNCKVHFNGKIASIYLKDSNKEIHSNELYSVWYRRPKKIKYKNSDEGIQRFIIDQSETFLQNFYYLTQKNTKWINPLLNLQQARNKFYQLALANEIGFNVPETVITNDFEKAINFVTKTESINKSLSKPYYHIDNEFYSYLTQKVSLETVENNTKSIEICPTLFQEFIDKDLDIRVAYFDKQVFAFAIHSQENEFSKTDFRGASPHLLKHERIEIPSDLKEKIIKFVDTQGLLFSALDFVKDKQGKYYFIENNPNGQWVWLEYTALDNELSKAMIKLLINEAI